MDPALRDAYAADSAILLRRGATAYGALAALVILATIPLDRARFPELAGALLPIRAAGAFSLAMLVVVLRTSVGARRPRLLAMLAPCMAGVVVLALVLRTGGAASPVNVSMNFILLGVGLVMPWSAAWSALAGSFVVAGYVGTMAALAGTLGRAFADDVLVLVATSALAVLMTGARERARRREFAQASALRESEARLRTVVADAPIILFALDRAGTVILSEGKGLARVGLAPGELVGRPLVTYTPRLGPLLGRALAGEAVTWTGGAPEATFECRLTPERDATGAVTGVIGLAIDLTERTQAEEARLALERKLLETQKLESLGVLAGGIAHDFNNLLVSVLGNASLALGELPPDAPVRPRLERIETAARRGAELTRQMLAYAGRGGLSPERVQVNELLAEMQDLLAVSMSKTVTMHYQPAPDLPAVEADPTQIRQVLMNLLVNASEAVGEADGTVTLRTAVVDLDAAALQAVRASPGATPGPHVLVEVTDTGCGMDAATADKIFDPFFSTKFTGRGLGLATVIGIVRRHRGALAVTTAPGRGTTFRVFLPCAPSAAAADATAAPPTPAAEPRGRTVLVVDDEDDVRAVTQHMLERLGCRVLAAADGREGIDLFRAHAGVIDAALVDLTLPRLGGEEIARRLRGIRPDTRVILMSGYDDAHCTGEPADHGTAGFLRKPFTVGDLGAMIDRALHEPPPDSAARPAQGVLKS